jgi:molecular chaperone DnaK (HSP70)
LQKTGEDPRENPRCVLRLYEAIEKARKLLSGDTEASVNIDYLINEEDLNRKLNRDEFELLRSTLEASSKFLLHNIKVGSIE